MAVFSKMKYPLSLQKLIDCFMLLPGIGPKNAERLAFFVCQKMSKEDATEFSESIKEVKDKVKRCHKCQMICDSDICDICQDEEREKKLIVVESAKEVIAIEKTQEYKGKYYVLDGLISPMNGINPEDILLDKLFTLIKEENIKEVIIATSANIDGEITAHYIKNYLNNEVEVTRIGYGLPCGGDIEYANEITLIKALEGRKKM